MQHHGAQTAAHSVEVDVDIDLEGDAAVAHEDGLHATIEQLNGMMSGNQVSATPVGSVASASAATEDDVAAAAATQLDSDRATADIVPLELNGEMVDGQGGSAANAEPTLPMSPTVTATTAQAVPAATPQAVEGVAPTEALQPLDVAPAAPPTADAVQVNDITVQATPELVDNNDIKPLIRLDAATPTTATSQITATGAPSAPSSTGLHNSSPRTHRKHLNRYVIRDCRSPFDPMTSAQSNSKFVPERTASKSLPRPPTNQVGLPLNLSS